ncbi:MAG: hypothetical protein WBL57_03210 [Methylovirgula sp.]
MVEPADFDADVDGAFCAKAGLKLRLPTMAMRASFDTWLMDVLLLMPRVYSCEAGGGQFSRARIATI